MKATRSLTLDPVTSPESDSSHQSLPLNIVSCWFYFLAGFIFIVLWQKKTDKVCCNKIQRQQFPFTVLSTHQLDWEEKSQPLKLHCESFRMDWECNSGMRPLFEGIHPVLGLHVQYKRVGPIWNIWSKKLHNKCCMDRKSCNTWYKVTNIHVTRDMWHVTRYDATNTLLGIIFWLWLNIFNVERRGVKS